MTNEPDMPDQDPLSATEPALEETSAQDPEALMRAASARIAELDAEKESFRDRWMRAEAEIANVRARARREVEDTRLFAVQKFAADMAEVAENMRRGLESMPKPTAGEPEVLRRLREGLEGIERGLLAALEKNGVRREDPTGAAFDPNLHQAMAEQESAELPPGTVLSAWTGAWTLNGRLVRPAMVVVAKAAPDEIAAPGGGPSGASDYDATA